MTQIPRIINVKHNVTSYVLNMQIERNYYYLKWYAPNEDRNTDLNKVFQI